MSLDDVYVKGIKGLKEITVLWGEEKEKKTALYNEGKETIILKSGYSTTANGSCNDLILHPGEAMIRTALGDGWSFACYRKKTVTL